jgi:hypothetical protein
MEEVWQVKDNSILVICYPRAPQPETKTVQLQSNVSRCNPIQTNVLCIKAAEVKSE